MSFKTDIQATRSDAAAGASAIIAQPIRLRGIIIASNTHSTLATIFSVVGIVLATINVVGGFLVTDRMLAMFKKSKK